MIGRYDVLLFSTYSRITFKLKVSPALPPSCPRNWMADVELWIGVELWSRMLNIVFESVISSVVGHTCKEMKILYKAAKSYTSFKIANSRTTYIKSPYTNKTFKLYNGKLLSNRTGWTVLVHPDLVIATKNYYKNELSSHFRRSNIYP